MWFKMQGFGIINKLFYGVFSFNCLIQTDAIRLKAGTGNEQKKKNKGFSRVISVDFFVLHDSFSILCLRLSVYQFNACSYLFFSHRVGLSYRS